MESPTAAEATAASSNSQAAAPYRIFDVMRAVFASALTPTQKLVALAILQRAGRDGRAWPGMGRIAKDSGYARRTVVGAVGALERAGWLKVSRSRRTSKGDAATNVYVLTIPNGGVVIVDHQGSDLRSLDVVIQDHQGSDPGSHQHLFEPPKRGGARAEEEDPAHRTPSESGAKRPKKEVATTVEESRRDLAWRILEETHTALRLKRYGSAGTRERVKTEIKTEIVEVLLGTAQHAHDTWRAWAPKSTWSFEEAYRRVVQDILASWFENPGGDDYLRARRHPLYVLQHDLTELEAEWRDAWAAYLANERAKATKSQKGKR